MTPLQALEKAVSVIGGQTETAAVCGEPVKQGHVWNWLNRDGGLPAKHAMKVQRATIKKGDAVYAHELCPDVFEAPAKSKRKKSEAA